MGSTADRLLKALSEVIADRGSLDRAEMERLIARHAGSFGAYMILRLLLTAKTAGLEAFDNMFSFAFAKAEYLAPALHPADPVLSIGCGFGQVETWLAGRGHPVTGVDTCPEMLAVARNLARSEGANADNPSFVEVAGTALPFAGGSFGSVLYLSSLHEMADRRASLAEAGRVLVAGGMVLAGEDETTWSRVPLEQEIGEAGFSLRSEQLLPKIFNHGQASPYVVREYVRTEVEPGWA